jgi:hypothetical protein
VEHYSAIKKSEIMLFAGKWIELEIIMLSEISQTEKDKYCMFSLICGIQNKEKKNDMSIKLGLFREGNQRQGEVTRKFTESFENRGRGRTGK